MPGNSFGKLFRITTFGESHGQLIGVVIDGVPAGLPLTESDINFELQFRKPGAFYTSPRAEEDRAKIVSGIMNGRTTGAPIAIVIENRDVDSSYYEELRFTPRPNHADMAYIFRYGFENWDYRGGGRASGRETVTRVAAGAVAKKLLMLLGTQVATCVESVGGEAVDSEVSFDDALKARLLPTRACKREADERFRALLEKVTSEGDSVGAVVKGLAVGVPRGLGEPIFDKVKADLAKAMLSIPGVVGFEIGLGFRASAKKGSEVADELIVVDGDVRWRHNVYGGVLGGVTTGEPIVFRVGFKPTSSIKKPVKTVDLRTMTQVEVVVRGRHDPCIGIRGAAVVEAMAALVLVDHAMRAGLIPTTRLSQRDAEVIIDRWERYRRCLLGQESQ
ncbi:MAG: chorismate synthase [Desulfurococcaceae archaeon]|jgi:chorismate synthase|nr:chorismate synthase [Desulfurococcaceae archaeon]